MWKAYPVVAVAILFDLARLFFGSFWFFGPAIGAAACTAGVDYATGIQATGAAGAAAASLCGAAAVGGGVYFGAALIAIGATLAFDVAVLGWMTITLWLLHRNPRIFMWNTLEIGHAIWFYIQLTILPAIPIIGCAPVVSRVVYKGYKFQIKMETKVLEAYNEEQAARANQEQQEQINDIARMRAMRNARAAQEAIEAEQEEIPEEGLLAA